MNNTNINDEQMNKVSGGTVIPYQVQPGDTLNAIAQRFNVSIEQLQRWNNIQNPNIITVGQTLEIKY